MKNVNTGFCSRSDANPLISERKALYWLRRMNYQSIITIEAGKRGGRPCIRRMRIAVADVLGWLAAGMSHDQILSDYPELTEEDIRACLAYAADRERRVVTAS
jgi:uncharacterized protein (DUF433 family)